MTPFTPKMLKTFAHKLASLPNRAWLPPALLLLALSSLFLFDGSRGHFRGTGGIHDQVSAKNMAITEHLSIDHRFLMFRGQTPDPYGNAGYRLNSRFPIGAYALIKLAILPFGDNLSAKILTARMLMLLFFVAAAVLAYLSLIRLTSSRWIALTAALLAFSSPYFMYYGDMISSEAIVDIFAVLLVFHAMALFMQEGRFLQLAVKTCAALLLGWHVYAMLLPFIAFGLTRELIKTRLGGSVSPLGVRQLKHTALSLLRSRYLTLGVVALLFGISMLTFNFTNEYFALNREVPFTETTSFSSMMNRTGIVPQNYENLLIELSWPIFLERQFHRIGTMALPYAFTPSFVAFVDHDHAERLLQLFVILGIAVSGASLIGLLFVRRHTILLATLALSGFCWALPMRRNTAVPDHNYEAMFYIGVTLTLFSLILLCLRRLSGERLIATLSIAAMLIFAFSALRMSQLNNLNQTAELYEDTVADFEVIRNMTDGKTIQVGVMPKFHREVKDLVYYYLSGRITMDNDIIVSHSFTPDFVVTSDGTAALASLTPQNREVFLYEWNSYYGHIDETIARAGAPIIQSDFDVYLNDNSLIYAKDDCSMSNTTAAFFLALHPVNESDLPAESKQYGSHHLDFSYQTSGIQQSNDRCIAIIPLPDYDIAYIYTGQYSQHPDGSTQRLWEGEFRPADRLTNDRLKEIDQTIAQAGAPIIQSDFDVYLNENSLIYAKDDCSMSAIADSFFLALYPVNESDLPAESKQYGSHHLDFSYRTGGIQRGGDRCIAIVPLPDYDIARIYTGQYSQHPDGSTQHLWEGEFRPADRLTNDRLKEIDETIAQAGEPIIRSDFDVYLNDNSLIYAKDDCSLSAIADSFFLALYPVDEIDLPAGSRQHGFHNLDFSYRTGGIQRSGDRCIAIVPLPDYDIARIYTGQYTQRADGSTQYIWEGEFRAADRLINDLPKDIDETIAQAGEPIIQSDFDVYISDDTLIYAKDSCSLSDTTSAFFLALYPADESALPVESRQRGFHNLDFNFQENGIRQADGRCVAVIPLPDYDIDRISTGQYTQRADGSTEHLWEGEFRPTGVSP